MIPYQYQYMTHFHTENKTVGIRNAINETVCENRCTLVYIWNQNSGNKQMSHHHQDPLINTLRPRQNGRHFPDDIFKWIFLNENVWILINISLKFVPRGPINNIPTLVQVMAWRRPGDKPLSESMMVRLATLGLNGLTHCGLVMPCGGIELVQYWLR